jgi:hypothetical protein
MPKIKPEKPPKRGKKQKNDAKNWLKAHKHGDAKLSSMGDVIALVAEAHGLTPTELRAILKP